MKFIKLLKIEETSTKSVNNRNAEADFKINQDKECII